MTKIASYAVVVNLVASGIFYSCDGTTGSNAWIDNFLLNFIFFLIKN